VLVASSSFSKKPGSKIAHAVLVASSFSKKPGSKVAHAVLATCLYDGFLLGLLFDPKDGSDIFLQNIR
jgi:hypothetical protein